MRFEHVIEIVRCLNAASVRYLAAGGLAVNAHGFVRYTNDLDLVVAGQKGVNRRKCVLVDDRDQVVVGLFSTHGQGTSSKDAGGN